MSTLAQADAYLAKADLCNTKQFPAEEFWTYKATRVTASQIDYDCTRTLRPQATFITPDTDLVVFTMGGNDAGFTNIVTQCFIAKLASGCQGAIDSARALLPTIKQRLLADVAGIRAAGLRDDAKIVQLGYPYLQLDNGYVAPVGLPPYPAGDAVRALIDDGTVALASVATDANTDHPGQMVFVQGIKEAFAGHEPDATTPVGNPDRWINQVGDGTNTSLFYHPNRFGQTAYAQVLLRGGDYGTTTRSTTFTARLAKRRIAPGQTAKVRTVVRSADGGRPRGKVLVKVKGRKGLVKHRVARSGRTVLRVRHLAPGKHRLKVTYRVKQLKLVRKVTVVVRRR